MDQEEKIILWGPRNGKTILKSHPEIANDPRFKGLSPDEIHFSWLIGIPNSPCDENWPTPIRHQSAASKSIKDKDKRDLFSTGQYPDEIKVAINAFGTFSPEARNLAKLMTQRIFHNFMALSDVDVEKDFIVIRTIGKGDDKEEIKEVDWTGKKQYIDSMAKMPEVVPALLKQLEEGFGVTEKQKSEEGFGTKSIDKFHNTKKDNSSVK